MMNKRWKYWLIGGVIAVGAASGSHLVQHLRWFEQLSAKAYDTHFALRGKQPTGGIVIIAADQKALDTFPELLAFWHPYYAEAIRAAQTGGAKVVALDVAFGIPVDKWAPGADRILAEAVTSVQGQVPMVMGFVPLLGSRQKDWVVPINMLSAALGLSGYANLTADSDDFIRRQELIESGDPKSNGPLARSFALRVCERALNTEVQLQGGRLFLAGKEIPTSGGPIVTIDFAGPPDTFPRISLADIVDASRNGRVDKLKEWLGGKIVMIGLDTFEDRHPTPFFSMQQGILWATAGVEVHANTVRTILEGRYILPVPRWIETTGVLALALLTFWCATALGTRMVAVAAAGALLAALAGSHALFLRRLTVSDSGIVGTWSICLLASIGYRFVTAEKRRDLFRRAVTMFVGKELTATLDRSEKIGLSGRREILTILFTDIRGFTAFCEDKDPSVVVDLLNKYMRQMVAIVVKHGGQVNKFIGDGILAIFSDDAASVPGTHAQRAVECAMAMVTAPNEFKTGAGLHTGAAVVGNVGSEDKMEYTVLGDTVNLASRLESLNKEHKTKLLMSGSTRNAIQGPLEATLLGAVPVRGKTEPIEIFTLTALLDTRAEAGQAAQ